MGTETTGARWRYQPVYRDDPAGRAVTLCECHFDADGRLSSWTADPAMEPMGEDIEELRRDLARMMADAYKWVPVPFDDLHVGMTFEGTGVDVERMIAGMEMKRSTVQ